MSVEKNVSYDDSAERRRSRISTGIRLQMRLFAHPKVYFQNKPEHRFVVLAQGRSGGTLLESLLSSHPECKCDSEILYYPVFFPAQFVEYKSRISPKPCYGFRVKIYQLTGIQRRSPRKFLEKMLREGWKIIYLRRENVFHQAISNLLSERRNVYHDFQQQGQIPFHVPPATLLKYMEARMNYLEQEEKALHGLFPLILTYEQDLLPSRNHQQTATRVFAYLGIADAKVATPLVKSVPSDLRSVLENYDELIDLLRNSPYKRFLVDVI